MAEKFLIQDEENPFGAEAMSELIEKNREEIEITKKDLEKAQEDLKNTELKSRLEKQTASRMPSTSNPTDDSSMDKIGMEASVNKKKPLYGKKIAELNLRIKDLNERIKDLQELVKSQEKQMKDMENEVRSESTKEKTVIKASDFKSVVENYTKISLSESDIINILVDTQNPVMTKSEIVESIQNKLIVEADMNRDVSGSFESGTNEYSELLGSDLAKQMADQSFNEIARAIKQKTGKQRVTFDDVQQLMSSSLMNAAKEEYAYGIDRLEQKAVEMIRQQFHIPEGVVEFEATITGVPPRALGLSSDTPQQLIDQYSRQLGVKISEVQREGLQFERGNRPVPEGKTEEQMKPKIKRRKITNAMMHGSARKSQNIHHMDDQLRQENPRLGQNYSNLMAANDASYWMMNDADIQSQGRQGIHAGNVRVKVGQPPKIIAQGVVFPVLLHELAKGVVELISWHSLPVDAEEKRYVLDKTDTLADETNDIRLGPIIWEKFVAQIPTDNQDIISLTFQKLQELSDDEFNSIIEGLLKGSTNSQMEVKRIAQEAIEELEQEAADDALGVYGDDDDEEENGDVATPEEDEEDDVLKRILGDKEEEGPEESKDLNDMSVEELNDLMRSAVADEDYAFAAQIRDIIKNR